MSRESHDNLLHTDFQKLCKTLRIGLTVVTEQWSYPTGDWVSSVCAADIDGDGDIEVLAGCRDCNLHVLTKRGNLKWKFEREGEWVGTAYAIDNREALDRTRVVVGSRDSKVYGLDRTGRQLWQYCTEHVVRKVRVSDINRDGKYEVLVGSEDRYVHALECETGKLLWQYRTNGWIRGLFVRDIDGDGEVEILAGSGDKYLHVIDERGQLKWKHDIKNKIYSVFAIDLDKDGIVEILIASDAKDLRALTPNGQEKWRFQSDNRILSLFVADLNRDGHLEIIAGSEDKHIYFLDDQGKLLWKHNLGCRVFSVCASDLDNDGLIEVFVGAEDDRVHIFHVELIGGLLEKIRKYYDKLGKPSTAELDLLPTECALLQDLVNEKLPSYKEGVTIQQVDQLLEHKEWLQALSRLLILQQEKVQLLWSRSIGNIRNICFADLDGDNKSEIIVGTDEGYVHVLNFSGVELWSYAFDDRIRTIQVGDVNLDGSIEIIVASADGHVYMLSSSGETIQWHSRMEDWIESIFITDLSSQGTMEILMGSRGKKIHFYNHHLLPAAEPLTTLQSNLALYSFDLDNDSISEIVVGTDEDYVYVYKRSGSPLWLYRTTDRVRSLCVKDIDGDDQPEVIVGSEDRNVHVLDCRGNLKWRYYTPHRVLDVDAKDIDQDGKIEVLLGVANGHVYVLNCEGDLLWSYKVSDRVRGVLADDLDNDGNMEIAFGSEERMVYLLQVVDHHQIATKIERCWREFQDSVHDGDLLLKLARSSDPLLRAFTLTQISLRTRLEENDFLILDELVRDPSDEVRHTFSEVIANFYKIQPHRVRKYLDILSADREFNVRLALLDSLPEITTIDQHIGFEYLDRFTTSVDRWVRRSVVRKLNYLVGLFPQDVFHLLLTTAVDEKEWVRQESARVLAKYFDIHTENLITGARLLMANSVDVSVLALIEQRAKNSIVRSMFSVLVKLLSGMDESNISDRLKDTVIALEKTRLFKHGEETWRVYREFYRLIRMKTVDEIAKYRPIASPSELDDTGRFEDTLQVLNQLSGISTVLASYTKRERLSERLVSLLEAVAALEKVQTDLERHYSWLGGQKRNFPDRMLLEILLAIWRRIIASELGRLRGKAEIKPELRTKYTVLEDKVGVWLDIHNVGGSPAEKLHVTLKQNGDFEVVERNIFFFDVVPASGSVQAEFIIRPKALSVHLEFEFVYACAESRKKTFSFGDRLELHSNTRQFRPIPNPYSVGTPIQNTDMFYGREEDLEVLRESLSSRATNMVMVLYGQRRSGKSSLLNQLISRSYLAPHFPVHIDMQHETLEISTGKFLRNIAFAIYRSLKENGITISRPNIRDFNEDSTFAFDMFLDSVEMVRSDRKLIMMIDEFELLEQKVIENVLAKEIFEYFRSLMQHRQGINFLFSGTHTIEQLTAGYWSVFFNIARHHRLTKLSKEAATLLITQPLKEFLEFDPLAVAKIRILTADQPYLIQIICRCLVEQCNALQKTYITVTDVNTAMDKVIETVQIHYKWLWRQITQEERLILSILTQEGGDEGRSLSLTDIEEIYEAYSLPYDRAKILLSLEDLIEGDIVAGVSEGTRFRIPVGLMRRWIQEVKPLRKVMIEEFIPAR